MTSECTNGHIIFQNFLGGMLPDPPKWPPLRAGQPLQGWIGTAQIRTPSDKSAPVVQGCRPTVAYRVQGDSINISS